MQPTPHFSSVVFDCDSTLAAIEGIDELCRVLPPEEAAQVAALTNAAMNGDVPLAEVYDSRLSIVRPSLEDLEAVGRRYVERLVTADSGNLNLDTLKRHGFIESD